MPRPVWAIWLTTAIWIVVTGGLWAHHEYQLENGREISLKTVPIDPRDFLRGDYVILRYELSALDNEDGVSPGLFRQDQVVFVSIEERDGEWRAGGVGQSPPESGLFLRGRARRISATGLEVVYGIESFFVPEGEGKRYEEARNRNRLYATISVSPHGVARLKRLEIRNGE